MYLMEEKEKSLRQRSAVIFCKVRKELQLKLKRNRSITSERWMGGINTVKSTMIQRYSQRQLGEIVMMVVTNTNIYLR